MQYLWDHCQKCVWCRRNHSDWIKELSFTHCLRGRLVSLKLEADHADSAVQMRTGHTEPNSLRSYQNHSGVEGLRQQRDLF